MGREVSFDRLADDSHFRQLPPRVRRKLLPKLSTPGLKTTGEIAEDDEKRARKDAAREAAKMQARQRVFRLLTLIWYEPDQKKRPTFHQFSAVFLNASGWKDTEIAKFLDSSPASVRKLRHVGMERLKRLENRIKE